VPGKAPDERWQSASDLASELMWITESNGQAAGTAFGEAPGKTRRRAAWLIAGVLAGAAIVGPFGGQARNRRKGVLKTKNTRMQRSTLADASYCSER